MKKNKFENPLQALEFVKSNGASVKDNVIYVRSGTFGLKKIGVLDYLAKRGYRISWLRN